MSVARSLHTKDDFNSTWETLMTCPEMPCPEFGVDVEATVVTNRPLILRLMPGQVSNASITGHPRMNQMVSLICWV